MMTRVVLAICAALAVGGLLTAGETARAASTHTWTGLGASNNWSDAANWTGGVPVAGDTLVFPAGASRKTNTNNLAANTAFADIRFTGSGYDIGGNDLQVTLAVINNPGSGSNLIRLDIGGAGGVWQESGQLTLSGDNSFDGDVLVQEGILRVLSDQALGGEPGITIVSSGASLQLVGGVDPGTEGISVTGNGVAGDGALQSLSGTNIAPDLFINGGATIGVGNSVLIAESLDGDGALTLVGGGKFQVESTPYGGFPGELHVVEGNLTWNASAPPAPSVDVEQFGWLRGKGAVAGISVDGGRVWPGSGDDPGILTSAGPTIFGGGRFQVDLDGPSPGSGYGRLVTGGLSIDPAATLLSLDLDFAPAMGHEFTIVSNTAGGVQGTFYQLPERATFSLEGYAFEISYTGGDGNDVTLTVLRALAADLDLSLSALPSPVAAGELLVYTATVENVGPDAAAGVSLTMGTPAGTTFQSATGPEGWVCAKPSQSVSVACTGPALPAGQSAVFTLTFRVNAGATGPIVGTAGVSAQTNDPFSADNSATVSTPVGPGGGKPFRRFLPMVAFAP